jgi:hypothetical protein
MDSHEPGASTDEHTKLPDDRDIPSPAQEASGHVITDKERLEKMKDPSQKLPDDWEMHSAHEESSRHTYHH